MQIIHNKETIRLEDLKIMSEQMFGKLVKAVVDIEGEIMAIDAALHVDLEDLLLENESIQDNLWGINFHPSKFPDQSWVEFDSMINIRPLIGNMGRYVENEKIRKKILNVVNKLVQA
jgi:hypothetical protein